MKISYAITVCDEIIEIKNLLELLMNNKRHTDEIIVLYDKNGPKDVFDFLQSLDNIKLSSDYFNNDFAEWKNKLAQLCNGEYIFQIDADEIPSIELIKELPQILEKNKKTDLFFVPRQNIVEGITNEDILLWNWNVDNNIVNWPDYQSRIYRNNKDIQWTNKVHEIIRGHKYFTFLPKKKEFSILHVKTIIKQRKQNQFYSKLMQF
jgi:hypothetical protein